MFHTARYPSSLLKELIFPHWLKELVINLDYHTWGVSLQNICCNDTPRKGFNWRLKFIKYLWLFSPFGTKEELLYPLFFLLLLKLIPLFDTKLLFLLKNVFVSTKQTSTWVFRRPEVRVSKTVDFPKPIKDQNFQSCTNRRSGGGAARLLSN